MQNHIDPPQRPLQIQFVHDKIERANQNQNPKRPLEKFFSEHDLMIPREKENGKKKAHFREEVSTSRAGFCLS